jgi:hypothetical protein
MNLYLLQRIGAVDYDEAVAFVIRAMSPKAAREVAAEATETEGANVWTDPRYSTVELLASHVKGAAGVVLKSESGA